MTAVTAPILPGTPDIAHDAASSVLTTQALREFAHLAGLICEAPFASLTCRDVEVAWRRSGGSCDAFPDHRAFDEYTLVCAESFEVPNTSQDQRFVGAQPAVGSSAAAFYAGVPLLAADGRAFGTLAVLDLAPRQLGAGQRAALVALARQVAKQDALTQELIRARSLAERAQAGPYNTFDQAPIGIAYADREGRFLRCNRAFGQMLGFSPVELETMSIGQLTHEADFGRNADEIERLWRGEIDSYSLEKRYLRKDQSAVWVRVTAALVRDANGAPECSVGFLEAISDRKQMQEALQRNRNLLETVITDVPFAIMACDNDGRIFMGNPAAVDLFAIDTSDGSNRGGAIKYPAGVEIFLADGITRVADDDWPLARALRGETVSNAERMLSRHGGRSRTILYSARQLVAQSGECLGAVAVAQDITERKASELELERIHKQLLDASRLAGMAEVASNVLHNVGNVLTSVNVSASLVAECVKDAKVAGLGRAAAMLKKRAADLAVFLTSDERGRKLPAYLSHLAEQLQGNQRLALKELASLRDNIDHIKETVAMQQSYAKLCGVAETVAVPALVEDSLRMNAAALARHGVTVRREIDDDIAPISVDKHKILQILVNLIRNAKYACGEAERPDKLLTIRVQSLERTVRISVIDNGVGIDPDNMGRLFRHGFTTRKTGHGFGLHSGALAARELGGALTAHSDGPGCGATFVLELPRGEAHG